MKTVPVYNSHTRAKKSLVLVAIFLWLFASALRAETLSDMENVLSRFSTMDEFLADSSAVNEYYEAMRARYGNRFARQSYDRILSQIRDMATNVGQFSERAWETNKTQNLGTDFVLQNDVRLSGRSTNTVLWQEKLSEWKASLSEKALALGKTTSEQNARMSEVFSDRASKMANISPKDKGAFFKGLSEDLELHAAVAQRLLSYLEIGKAGARFASNDADLIALTLNDLAQFPELALSGEVEKNFKNLAKTALKDLEVGLVLDNDEIFPKKTESNTDGDKMIPIGGVDSGEVEAVAIPRRFHAFFKHIILNECVGGGVDHLDSTTPERWATVLLSGSQMHELQKSDGKFMGYTQVTPLRQREEENARLYGNIDFGSTILKHDALIADDESPTGYRRTTFFDQWLSQMETLKPESWRGFVVPEYQDGDNTHVLKRVRQLPAYVLGPAIDMGEYLLHLDPVAKAIVDASPKEGFAGTHGGNMILDTTKSHEERVIKLVSGLSVTERDLDDFAKIKELYLTLPPSQRMRVVEFLKSRNYESKDVLFELLKKEPSAGVRSVIAWALADIGNPPTAGGISMMRENRRGTTKGQTHVTLNVHYDEAGNIETDLGEKVSTVESLKWALNDPDASVRAIAGYGLIRQGVHDLPELNELYARLSDGDASKLPHLMLAQYRIEGIQPRSSEYDDFRYEVLEVAKRNGAPNQALVAAAINILNAPHEGTRSVEFRISSAVILGQAKEKSDRIRRAIKHDLDRISSLVEGANTVLLHAYKNETFEAKSSELDFSSFGMELYFRDTLSVRFLEVANAYIDAGGTPTPEQLLMMIVRTATYRDAFGEEHGWHINEPDAHAFINKLANQAPAVILLVDRLRGGFIVDNETPNVGANKFIEEAFKRLLERQDCGAIWARVN